MRQIIYASVANARSAESLASDILRGARAHNGISGVTGLLCAAGDRFMQLLEGPEESVASAMERVRADRSHRDIEVMIDRTVASRAFGDWTMAYRERGSSGDELADRLRVSLIDAPPEIAARFSDFIR